MRGRRLCSVVALATAVLVLGLALGGCSGTDTGGGGPGGATGPTTTLPAEETGDSVFFVAVGGDETLGFGVDDGVRQGWAQLLFRERLPRRSVHVNLASSGATVADALAVQVPLASELDPTLVTVWLAGPDAARATPVPSYERDLEQVVRQLQGGGRAVVAVAVGSPITADARATAPYDAAAERVVGRTGAALVDLRSFDPGMGVGLQEELAAAFADALDGAR